MKKICFVLFLCLQITFVLTAQPISVSENDNQDIKETWNKVVLLQKNGKFPEAEKVLRELASRHPNHAGVWSGLGYNLFRQKKTDEAILAFKRSLNINPNWLSSNRYLGLVYLHQKQDYDSAILYLKKAYELQFQDFKKRNIPLEKLGFFNTDLAEALFGAKRFEEASIEYEKFVALAPDKDYYKTQLAVCYLELKRLSEAENIIKPMIDSNTENYRVWKIYADILTGQNKPSEADEAYQKYRNLCPKCKN